MRLVFHENGVVWVKTLRGLAALDLRRPCKQVPHGS